MSSLISPGIMLKRAGPDEQNELNLRVSSCVENIKQGFKEPRCFIASVTNSVFQYRWVYIDQKGSREIDKIARARN